MVAYSDRRWSNRCDIDRCKGFCKFPIEISDIKSSTTGLIYFLIFHFSQNLFTFVDYEMSQHTDLKQYNIVPSRNFPQVCDVLHAYALSIR